MPFRGLAIAGLVVLALALFAGPRLLGDDEDDRFVITPELIDDLRVVTLPSREPLRVTPDVDLPPATAPLGPAAPPIFQAEYLDVTLDPSGRPYDEPLQRRTTVERRPLAVLHAPSRRLPSWAARTSPTPMRGRR